MKTLDNGVEREMTTDELANYNNLLTESKAAIAAAKAQAATKLSAQTKLAALGLTADEIAAL